MGPTYIKHTNSPWQDDGKLTVDINSSQQLTIEQLFNVTLNIGVNVVSDVKIQLINYVKYHKDDIYVCHNGMWVHDHSVTCTAQAVGELTTPSWWAYLQGFGQGGAAGKFGPFTCDVM